MATPVLAVLCDEPRCDRFGGTHECVALDDDVLHDRVIDGAALWSVTAGRLDGDREWSIAVHLDRSVDLSAADAARLAGALLNAADFCRVVS